MKRRVNAEIKSQKDAFRRLLDGEVFWYEGSRIFYSGMLHSFRSGAAGLKSGVNKFELWEQEVAINWYDNIPKCGVLCWVGSSYANNNGSCRINIVVDYIDNKFIAHGGNKWAKALPLTKEEVMKLVLGEE